MSQNPPEDSAYLQIAYTSVNVFGNDGTIDLAELNFLLGLALRDGQIDDQERKVLRSLFDRAETTDLSDTVRERIAEVRRKHEIGGA